MALPLQKSAPTRNPRARLWSHVASMNGMSAPDTDTRIQPSSATPTSGATPTVPQVVKPFPAYARTLGLLSFVVFPARSLIGVLTRDH